MAKTVTSNLSKLVKLGGLSSSHLFDHLSYQPSLFSMDVCAFLLARDGIRHATFLQEVGKCKGVGALPFLDMTQWASSLPLAEGSRELHVGNTIDLN